MTRRLQPKCPTTGKRRYRDELAAKLALADIDRRRRGTGRELDRRHETRAYACRACSGWHLTSRATARASRPLRARSTSVQRTYRAARRPLVAALLAQHPACQLRIDGVCTHRAVDVHELLSRARGGSITDPANCRTTCRPCHDYVTTHPADAQRLGLALPSPPRRGDPR